MTTPACVLRKAKELIETKGWTQGEYGSDECGFCAVGALRCAADPYDMMVYHNALDLLSKAVGEDSVIEWNDADDRAKPHVLNAFSIAILLAEQEESR